MDSIKDLIIPLLVIGGFSLYFHKILLQPSQTDRVIPPPAQGILELNVFKGRNSQVVSISSTAVPRDLARIMYTETELQGNDVIFVYSGRKLSNDRSFSAQGVRNNSFLHSQIAGIAAAEVGDREYHSYATILISATALLLFWYFYFNYPNYFTFVSRVILIGLSEVLGIFLYLQLKST